MIKFILLFAVGLLIYNPELFVKTSPIYQGSSAVISGSEASKAVGEGTTPGSISPPTSEISKLPSESPTTLGSAEQVSSSGTTVNQNLDQTTCEPTSSSGLPSQTPDATISPSPPSSPSSPPAEPSNNNNNKNEAAVEVPFKERATIPKDPESSVPLSSAEIAEIERVDIPQEDGTIPPAVKSTGDISVFTVPPVKPPGEDESTSEPPPTSESSPPTTPSSSSTSEAPSLAAKAAATGDEVEEEEEEDHGSTHSDHGDYHSGGEDEGDHHSDYHHEHPAESGSEVTEFPVLSEHEHEHEHEEEEK